MADMCVFCAFFTPAFCDAACYLFIWAIPGSMVLLPFLAWFLDRQRKKRAVERRRLKE